jgi:hypothetical protein
MSEVATEQKQAKFRFEFQPTLEDGTPIGGIQVIEADTQDELMNKMSANYTHLYRRNRELMQDKIQKDIQAPEGAEKSPSHIKLNPRPLTAAERMKLVRDFSDPETIETALETALEAKLGAKPSDVAATATNNSTNLEALRAQQEATAWKEAHPNFYPGPNNENAIALAQWIQDRGLKFNQANIDKAFTTLDEAALLIPAPLVAGTSEAEQPPQADPTGRITGEEPSATRRPSVRTSGITRQNSSTSGENVQKNKLTREQIDSMSAEEYKRKMKDPKFVQAVNSLYSK